MPENGYLSAKRMSSRWLHPDYPFLPSRVPVFYGWIIGIFSTVGVICSIPGQTMVMSVFADVFIEQGGISRTQLTLAYLIGTAISGLAIPAGGRWYDRIGGRLFMVLISVLFGIAAMGMSQIDRVGHFLQRLRLDHTLAMTLAMAAGFFSIRFFGQGLLTLGSRAMLAKWWDRKRGLINSVSGVFVGAVFSTAPIFFSWEIAEFGWRGAWWINGLSLCLVLGLLSWLFSRDNPEECGLRMDGGTGRGQAASKNHDLIIYKDYTRREAMGTYSFWIFSLGLGLLSLYGTTYTFHVMDIARFTGTDQGRMLDLFWKGSIASIPISIFSGWVVEYVRLRYLLIALGIGGAFSPIGVLMLPALPGEILIILSSGLAWGTFPVLISVTFARYFGRTHLGAISGISMSLVVFGSAMGPFILSAFNDVFGGYAEGMVLMAVAFATISILACFAENPQRKLAGEMGVEQLGD